VFGESIDPDASIARMDAVTFDEVAAGLCAGGALQSATGFGFALIASPVLVAASGGERGISALTLISVGVNLLTLTIGVGPRPRGREQHFHPRVELLAGTRIHFRLEPDYECALRRMVKATLQVHASYSRAMHLGRDARIRRDAHIKVLAHHMPRRSRRRLKGYCERFSQTVLARITSRSPLIPLETLK